MRKASLEIGSLLVLSLLLTAVALPAWGATCQNKIGKIAIVAKSGGDYTGPVSAMSNVASWCGTPSEANACLIKVMPGVYDLAGASLTMQPYVDIEGSGENETTVSSAVNSLSSGVVNGAGLVEGDNCTGISNLTVKNTASSGTATAIYIGEGQTMNITHVTATVKGDGNNNYAIFNLGNATMSNVTASASGATSNFGVYYGDTGGTMSHITATAEGGSFSHGVWVGACANVILDNVTAAASGATSNYGVYNADSSMTMNQVIATAKGGSYSYGVYNSDSDLTMSNVTAAASGAASNYGLYNILKSDPSGANVNRSTFRGSTNSVFTDTASGSGVNIAYSELVGPAGDGGGTLICIHSYNGNYVALGANCQ